MSAHRGPPVNHSPAPWRLDTTKRAPRIFADNGRPIANLGAGFYRDANGERIVRCVNAHDDLANLVELADALRAAQRAYMADRGNETLGRAVGAAAQAYDDARAKVAL